MNKSPFHSAIYILRPYIENTMIFEKTLKDIKSEEKNRRMWKLARKRK